MSFNYSESYLFELGEMPTPDTDGWTPEEIGPTLNFEEMSEKSYDDYHTQVPLSPEAEEMLSALTVGSQVAKLDAEIHKHTQQRDELLGFNGSDERYP